MKILQINKFYYQQGGAERYFFALKELLEKNGHEVIPFAMHDARNVASPWSEFFVFKVETQKPKSLKAKLKTAGRMFYSLEAKKKLNQLILETKPDIAHIHNIYHQLSPSILPVLKKHKIPVVMTVHDYKLICPNYILYTKNAPCVRCKKTKYYHAINNRCLKNSYSASIAAACEMYLHKFLKIYEKNIDLFIAPSNFVKEKLVEFGWQADKIVALPHFINLPKIIQNRPKEKYLLYLGRLSQEKGVDTLIKAMIRLPDVELKIIGSGPAEKQLKDLVNTKNLKNINFIGSLETGETVNYLKEAQVLIIPSRVWETFGLVVLEAMAYRVPVIASNLGGLPELIEHKKTGLLFKAEDSDDLAEKIIYLLDNPVIGMTMAEAGQELVEKNFTQNKHYQGIIKLYEKVKIK